jgi:lysophospholipase L1-like esterase
MRQKINQWFPYVATIVVTFFVFEGSSFFLLKWMFNINPFEGKQPYANDISGYYVTKNTPNFHFSAYAYDEKKKAFIQRELQTDSNGFICDTTIAESKDSNTLRIFICGGSTAFGSIQNQGIVSDRTYVQGTYTYEWSLAGMLKQRLAKLFPNKKIEVINAAVNNHFYHQTWLLYLAKVRDFHPDVLINLYGNNDGLSIAFNAGFDGAEASLNQLLALKLRNQEHRWPFSVYLINLLIDKYSGRLQVQSSKNEKLQPISVSESDYLSVEPFFKRNSEKLIWCLASFENQLQTDGVLSLSVIQPLLRRKIAQKELSPLELGFLNDIQASERQSIANNLTNMSNSKLNYLKQKLGSKINETANIMFGYYFDDYFTNVADSLVKSHHGLFIDMNKRIKGLKANQEFYVDYCHLTPAGNEFVADQLVNDLYPYLRDRN